MEVSEKRLFYIPTFNFHSDLNTNTADKNVDLLRTPNPGLFD